LATLPATSARPVWVAVRPLSAVERAWVRLMR
jgi:hypothetical protein